MDTVPQDAFATLGLAEEGGEGLTGLARALLEAGVNEMMAAQAGKRPKSTKTSSVEMTSSLSARGSRNLPKFVTWS